MLDQTAIDEVSVSHHIDQEVRRRDNSYIRASGIGQCRRQIAYRLLYHRQGKRELPFSTHLLTIFELGHGLHLKLQERMSNIGPLKWVDAEPAIDADGRFAWKGNCEIPLIDHEYRVAGTCDGLSRPLRRYTRIVDGEELEFLEPAQDGGLGRRYIIDFKTITARERVEVSEDPETGRVHDWKIKPSAYEKLTAPKPEHVQQTALYAWLATRPDFQTDRDPEPLVEMPGIMIVYLAKDLPPDYYKKRPEQFEDPRGLLNSPYKIFVLEPTQAQVKVILRKVSAIWKAVDNGELPARDFHHTPQRPAWPCVDCSYRAECYETEGYFANELPMIPPRLAHRLSELDGPSVAEPEPY